MKFSEVHYVPLRINKIRIKGAETRMLGKILIYKIYYYYIVQKVL